MPVMSTLDCELSGSGWWVVVEEEERGGGW